MSFDDLVRLVLSNLSRMKARVAMTAIGVTIGAAAVIVLVSLGAGLQRSATADLGSIGDLTTITVYPGAFIRAFGGGSASGNEREGVLTDQALDELADLPGVLAVSPRESLQAAAAIKLNRLVGGAEIAGIDTRVLENFAFPLVSGTDHLGRWQALAGARLADTFFDANRQMPPEQPPNLEGATLLIDLTRYDETGEVSTRSVRVRVVGMLEEGGQNDYTLLMPLRDIEELNAWATGRRPNRQREGYNQAIIKVEDNAATVAVEQEILQRGFFAYSARTILSQLNVVFLAIQAIFGGIGAIALIVAAFGIANTMIMAIYERTREIGLMKAVGATNRDVMTIFLAEASGIGLLGGIGGVILGTALSQVVLLASRIFFAQQVAQSGGGGMPTDIIYTPLWLLVFALVFSTAVGLISGVYPAMRAASLSPLLALKYE